MTQSRCQLERLGAPKWACALAGIVLGLVVVVYVIVISMSVWGRPGAPVWLLALVWTLGALAIALVGRSVLAMLRSRSDPDANKPAGSSSPDSHEKGV